MTNYEHRFSEKNRVIMFNGQYCIESTSKLKDIILTELHCALAGGHAGYYQTLQWINQNFYWKGITSSVKEFAAQCKICQQIKVPPSKPLGLL